MKWVNGLRALAIAAAGSLALAACGQNAEETAKGTEAVEEYTIGWTIYAGWMPWPYAEQAGIVKKWSDKYGVNIKLVQVND